MRPRVFPAEDAYRVRLGGPNNVGFNEAAGIPRGRLRHPRLGHESIPLRFNEAAGIPRGRQIK